MCSASWWQLPNYPQMGLLSLGGVEFPCPLVCEEPQELGLLCSILGVGESSCLFLRLFFLWGAAAEDRVWGKELATSQCPRGLLAPVCASSPPVQPGWGNAEEAGLGERVG